MIFNKIKMQEGARYTSQDEALLHMMSGDNVFISGPAGSGKSYTIQKFCNLVKKYYPHINIFRTSTTGISALNIDGMTIHKYSGMGASGLKYSEAIKNEEIKRSWGRSNDFIKMTDILIIDEVSMLSERGLQFLLERIRYVYRNDKNNNIQIIASGDFTQLPPVNTSRDRRDADAGNFCYGAEAWHELNFRTLYLDKLYRSSDNVLSKVLTEITYGKGNSKEVLDVIASLKRTNNEYLEGSTLLLSKNVDVTSINSIKQKNNKTTIREAAFETRFNGLPLKRLGKKILEYARRYNIPHSLTLRDGDTVMVTSNMVKYDVGDGEAPLLRNGTIGTFRYDARRGVWGIVSNGYHYRFIGPHETEVTETKWKKGRQIVETKGVITQYPLKLAYAITIHKAQGQTLSKFTTDLTSCWTTNLGYVSLSRATSLCDITLIAKDCGTILSRNSLLVSPKSVDIKRDILNAALWSRIILENDELENYKYKKCFNYFAKQK